MEDINYWQDKFSICVYSKKLLNKLFKINNSFGIENLNIQVDIVKIKKAIFYAKKYHGSQMRASGEPFYSHTLEVAYMVSDYLFNTDILITCILHDTLEDTELTKENLSKIFNQEIALNVEDLNRKKPYGKISANRMIELLWLGKKPELLLVKYFDRLHNLQTINSKPPEKISKTLEETFKQFISLSLYLKGSIPDLYNTNKYMLDLCFEQLNKLESTKLKFHKKTNSSKILLSIKNYLKNFTIISTFQMFLN
jgi:(p)ppGpp synthase/HD superfamily hydrolase